MANAKFSRESATNRAILELYYGHAEVAEFYEGFAYLMEEAEQDIRYGQRAVVVPLHPRNA